MPITYVPLTTPLLNDAIEQNNSQDNGVYPQGVPPDYSWYAKGTGSVGFVNSPPGFTAMTFWFHMYPQSGVPFSQGTLEIKEFNSWVHKKSGGWTQVQDVPPGTITTNRGGGYFKQAITPENVGMPGLIINNSVPGIPASMLTGPAGGMLHIWSDARGTYPADSVNGVFGFMIARLTTKTCKQVVQMGVDWWRDAGAPFKNDFSNNPGLGTSDWHPLDDQFRYYYYTNLTPAQLQADPPPGYTGQVIEPPEPEEPEIPGTTVLTVATMTERTTGVLEGDVWNLWSVGSISQPSVQLAAGKHKFVVEARGSIAVNVWPNMTLRIDDMVIANLTVNTIELNNYEFPEIEIAAGAHKVGVGFTNDGHGPGTPPQDRNLYVKSILIVPPADVIPPEPEKTTMEILVGDELVKVFTATETVTITIQPAQAAPAGKKQKIKEEKPQTLRTYLLDGRYDGFRVKNK